MHIYTHIHVYILSNLSKENFQTVFFHDSYKKICIKGQHFFNSSPKILNFDTHYYTVIKQISAQNI